MLQAYIDFIKSLITKIPFNAFDYAVLIAMGFYIIEDISFGAVASALNLTSTLLSFFIGLIFYPIVAKLLVSNLSFTKGIADAVSFLIVVVVSFIFVSFVMSIIRRKYISIIFPKKIDMTIGGIFGLISFFFIASFVISILLSFPTSGVIKDSIRNSIAARFFFTKTQGIDNTVRKIFGGAIEDTINFLTVKPGSTARIGLNFKADYVKADIASEQKMLELINSARKKNRQKTLSYSKDLTEIARAHARDMLKRGYFSHYTIEGFSPFDRMAEASVIYQYAGENLAFAPDVEIAMDGLMKSPGHKANILSPDFVKMGIGILDAGIYGKMFVQEFTD